MSGNIVTQSPSASCTPSRACRELGLRRGEFDLAVNLGHIRTMPDEGGGGLRVARSEIDRLHAEEGFPEALKKRVETVGAREGAELLEVSHGRFTRLARLGVVVPVRFYLNRYRAVVWLYLAEELAQFEADETNAPLLSGRTPADVRGQLADGLDLRPRNWRGRHLGFLRRQAGDHPWAHAAAVASLLDAVQVAEIVQDPYERTHLNRFRPRTPAHGAPDSPAAHLAERITMAQDPDEIGWLRADLAQAVSDARRLQPAPRPTPALRPTPSPCPGPVSRPSPTPRPSLTPRPNFAPLRSTPAPRPAPEPRPAEVPKQTQPTPPATIEQSQPTPQEAARPRTLLGWLRRKTE
ncbi:DUF6397 family protein [Streptomyces spinosirectus]|uniref:DUF6397 family protein n=1 Tax=Streptomyces TaxID=1883 RepID=UPI001F38A623|nr:MULTISPECIES: DUF6397 family protein [Streptomyces]MBY8338520.1 hypothetical protein [Streptomyces plumbidurans]UIR16401.1 DUF6397 family protein [Streptomyces spinosirectus]